MPWLMPTRSAMRAAETPSVESRNTDATEARVGPEMFLGSDSSPLVRRSAYRRQRRPDHRGSPAVLSLLRATPPSDTVGVCQWM